MEKNPELGLTTYVNVVKVIDGDTVKVEIKRQFNVRIADIDVCEINTEKGKIAKSILEEKILGKKVVLFIPSNEELPLLDINSFERIVGSIWIDGVNICDILEPYKK